MNLNCVLGKDGRRIKEFIAWGVKMPIYEYECKSCRQIQEILQGSAEEPALKCAHCGSTDFKRLISAAFVSTGAFLTKVKLAVAEMNVVKRRHVLLMTHVGKKP
jgi:putative FmdB family regulatory protein